MSPANAIKWISMRINIKRNVALLGTSQGSSAEISRASAELRRRDLLYSHPLKWTGNAVTVWMMGMQGLDGDPNVQPAGWLTPGSVTRWDFLPGSGPGAKTKRVYHLTGCLKYQEWFSCWCYWKTARFVTSHHAFINQKSRSRTYIIK